MKLKIEGHKPRYNHDREATCEAPEWWLNVPFDQRGVEVGRKDRVDNTGFGDVFEVTWWGLVD